MLRKNFADLINVGDTFPAKLNCKVHISAIDHPVVKVSAMRAFDDLISRTVLKEPITILLAIVAVFTAT